MKIKNLFFGMLAFAGMLAVASCSQDDFVGGETAGDYVDATFTVSTPDGIGTRAIGDGTTVNRVKCCVYDAKGVKMNLDQNLAIVGKEAQYNVRLAKGQAYNVVFFAYNGDEQGNSKYYKIDDLKKIEVLGNQSSNVEERDAFTRACHVSANETMNRVEKTVVLKRPLAQLNLGIDATELADAANAGIVIEKSKIIVSNVYSFYNAYDSTVVGKDTVVVFKMNAIPTEPLKVTIDGVEKEYNYLAMNYLLVGDLGSEKTLTDVEFVWETADGNTNVPSTSFPNVTTQRNYRTNILGKLITNPATFNVVIDERFDGEKNKIYTDENGVHTAIVSTPDELVQAIEEANKPGDYVIRLKDFFTTRAAATLEFTIVQKPGVNLVIDGCNVTFDGTFYLEGGMHGNSPETLTFRNINFVHGDGALDFISAGNTEIGKRYVHNVSVENCTFTGNEKVVAVRCTQYYNFAIKNSTATNLHSLLQAQSCDDKIYIEGVNVVDCKSGVSFGNTAYPTIINSNIVATGYGVRADGGDSRGNLVIKNTTVNAAYPVAIRKMTTKYAVALEGNTLETSNKYEVVFTNNKDEDVLEVPTGKYTITGAEKYNVYPIKDIDYKDYVRKLNIAHNKNSTISVSTGADFLPIVAVNPEIYGYSVYDGDTRIANAVTFRFSNVKKETISENSYKVSFNLAVLDENGNKLEIKDGRMNPYITTDPREHLNVYMNLIEVPADYAISQVKVGDTVLTPTQNTSGNCATGEYWIGYEAKDLYFQSRTAGLIEVTLTK
ncbi:MAG: hypothetical protein IKV17_00790 [Bacteroidaceae bacterium]|nr:hypothetical protein [Bacteroidaceae bacterium]